MTVKKDKVMAEVQLRCGPFVVTSLMSAIEDRKSVV